MLKDADPKNGADKSIAEWFKGQPSSSRAPAFPWGWVEWLGGEMKHDIGSVTAEINDKFLIAVLDKHINVDKAEDSIMDFADTIETALESSVLLGGLVIDSWIINREKQKSFENDYSVVAVKITLFTRRRK